MSKDSKKYVGQIGYCENIKLGLKKYGKPLKGGHYVYIRKVNDNGKCDVNVITSLEDKNKQYQSNKINKVKYGYLYPIPKDDANFCQWSAVNLDGNIKGVNLSDIQSIGSRKIKRRHKFFVGKFTKK